MNIKLLFIVNDPVFFLSHRLPIARAARKSGFEVHVATPREDSVGRILDEGFFFHPLRLTKHGTGTFGEIRSFFSILHLFRSLQPSIVHLVTIKPVLYGGIAARLAEVPAVVSAVTGRGILFVSSVKWKQILGYFAKRLYRYAFAHKNQVVIFQNPDDMAFFVDAGLVKNSKTSLIKGSGVDTRQFVPGPGSLCQAPIVLLAGRMLREKGVGDFVAAARILRRRGVPVRFVLAGSSPEWNKSSIGEGQLQAWHEEGVVEWLGNCEEMHALLAKTAVACLPSFYGEGVPKFLIEAAACGCPIVTTDIPGCREIVHDGENGFLVPVNDVEALSVALEKLLGNAELRASMGLVGRRLAVAEFSEELVVQQTLNVYGRLLPVAGAST